VRDRTLSDGGRANYQGYQDRGCKPSVSDPQRPLKLHQITTPPTFQLRSSRLYTSKFLAFCGTHCIGFCKFPCQQPIRRSRTLAVVSLRHLHTSTILINGDYPHSARERSITSTNRPATTNMGCLYPLDQIGRFPETRLVFSFSAWVEVDGKPLQLYQPRQDGLSVREGWIASEPGKVSRQ
jgi:hypothetical protein